MTTDGIIFDVDGTLWDATKMIAARWNQLFAGEPDLCGLRITGADLKKLFGKLLKEIGEILFQGCSPKRQAELLEKCYLAEEEVLRTNPPAPYEGICEAVRSLSARFPLFIVSNCQAGYIELFLESTGLGPYFTGHLCPGDTGLPKADNIRLIVERHGLKRGVYVGDTALDAASSKSAGVPFVFASYGFGQVPAPDYAIKSPWDLINLFAAEEN